MITKALNESSTPAPAPAPAPTTNENNPPNPYVSFIADVLKTATLKLNEQAIEVLSHADSKEQLKKSWAHIAAVYEAFEEEECGGEKPDPVAVINEVLIATADLIRDEQVQRGREAFARLGAESTSKEVVGTKAASESEKKEVIDTETLLTQKEAQDVLSVQSRNTIKTRVKNNEILMFKRLKKDNSYPAWQFRNGAPLPGLKAVLDVLDCPPLQAHRLIIIPLDRMGGVSIVELLYKGRNDDAREAAKLIKLN